MSGNVLVDELETTDPPPSRSPTPRWLGLAGAAVVVGVLGLLPGQSEAPPPTVTIPDVELAEDRWTPLLLPGSGALNHVAPLAGGRLVAVGDGPQIWTSPDRLNWRWGVDVEVPPGSLEVALAFGQGGVAVGDDHLDDGDTKASIWHSEDGSNWRRAAVPAAVPSGLEGVTAGDGTVVAWGWQGSQGDFAFDGDPLLLVSTDGANWEAVDVPANFHIDTVHWIAPDWYFGGYVVGHPALWRTSRLGVWKRVPTEEMIFGWSVVGLEERPDGLVATLSDLSGYAGMRRWRQGEDGAWALVEEPPELPLSARGDGSVAAGDGRLWEQEDGHWRQLAIDGEVSSAADRVAVGTDSGRPLILVRDAAEEVDAAVAPAGDGVWTVVGELGVGPLLGVWPVADGWVIGTESEWWFHAFSDGGDAARPPQRFNPVWTDGPRDIRRVGEAWVALPGMEWTVDGTDWDRRTFPWFGGVDVPGRVEGLTAFEDEIVAVGFNPDHLWTVSSSPDGGRNWELIGEPTVATPLWDVAGIEGGFVATAAREQGRREVVTSDDGTTWEPLEAGAVLVAGSPTPAAVTADGDLWLLDGDRRIPAPRRDIDLVLDGGDRVVVRTQDAIWVHEGRWERFPLDAPHGILGPARPMLVGDTLQAVVSDGDRVVIQEWRD